MIIANNATFKLFVSDYNRQNSELQTSMSKLASGNRLITPGESPADLGISERFRNQFRNSDAANRVIQNGINMFQTTDSWMQEAQDMINRMSELAVASADGSKGPADRQNLELEFQQLKTEVARIAEAGKYNGLQINGKTAVSVWDAVSKTVVYMQPDGTDRRDIGINLKAGNASMNGVSYSFEKASGQVGDFLFTKDGKDLIYVAQSTATGTLNQKTLVKLNLETNTIQTIDLHQSGGSAANLQARIAMDEKGRIWVGNPSGVAVVNSASRYHRINLLRMNDMTLDSGGSATSNAWAGGVTTASGFSLFAVHNDYVYFIESAAGNTWNYSRQNIYDANDTQVLVANLSANSGINMDLGDRYAISHDGQYLAFEMSPGQVKVVNAFTGETDSRMVGSTGANTVTALAFDQNNRLYWTDTGTVNDANSIKRLKIKSGSKPEFYDEEVIYQNNVGHLGAKDGVRAAQGMGLSIGGGTPAGSYEFQIGPDYPMSVDFVGANLSLTNLGIGKATVLSIDFAQEAIGALAKAHDLISNQRAVIGSEVSRLGHIFSANDSYKNNITQAESRIRDVDFAEETTKLTSHQVLTQAALSMVTQSNQSRQNVLSLLRGG